MADVRFKVKAKTKLGKKQAKNLGRVAAKAGRTARVKKPLSKAEKAAVLKSIKGALARGKKKRKKSK